MYKYKDKAANIQTANRYMLSKTLTMFEWQGLPETIPARQIELLLQTHGYIFITEVEGKPYAFTGGLGGEPDAYYEPTEIVISNPALKFMKTLNLKDDGVLIRSDDMGMGMMPLFDKFNGLLAESDITMVVANINSRIGTLISASDDKTKQSAELFLKRIADGDQAVIAENAMLEGVKSHTVNNKVEITDLVEYHQYVKAGLMHEIGLSAAFNMKRERVNASEVAQNDDGTYPFVDNMMKNRLDAVKALKARYPEHFADLDVDYGSVWSKRRRDTVDGVVEPTPAVVEEVPGATQPIEPQPTEKDLNDGTTGKEPVAGAGEGGPGEVAGAADQQDPEPAPKELTPEQLDELWAEAILEDEAYNAAKEKQDDAQ